MEKTKSSSTARAKAKAKYSPMCFSGFDAMNEDLLLKILSRLPAQSFASAACVNKSWNRVCNRVLSRPKLASALSLKPSLHDALKEVFDKILSEPIRPHFAIANVGSGFELQMTLRLIRMKLGCLVPIVVSVANGIIGRDALTDELKEVNWHAHFSDFSDEADAVQMNEGIVMTIAFFPGLKIDAIPLVRRSTTPLESAIDKFVTDIKEYSAFPEGILLFGEGSSDMKPVMEKLDYAMPKDTFIIGNERGCVAYRSRNDSRNACTRTGYSVEAVALVFAQDINRSSAPGEIKFHVALSNGILPVGDKYKTASVRTRSSESSTWLTARREGQQEILDGQRILDGVNDELANHIETPELYIGVFKRRKLSIGSEKPRQGTSIAFHGVVKGDEEYLYVDGVGLKTGDIFQFYHSDCNTALASCARVSDELKKIKLEANSKNLNVGASNGTCVFGGFVFACCGRGESFFGRPNVDSSPISENFPGAPLSGMFCCGEMARSSFIVDGQCEGENSIACCVHAYSSVYLLMSYTPSQ
ncbi:F-box/LRR-repeat protein At5g63520 [Prosopis cineraria]|uniref:F-box/LRR-repeat protein At5g63520 n=1 Tax=Prosopis cineraria TaxID=364024 RepID=UPI00240F6372|nr:F-box/LRR-repeat protein At5g63520 [Prosopis cineraria]